MLYPHTALPSPRGVELPQFESHFFFFPIFWESYRLRFSSSRSTSCLSGIMSALEAREKKIKDSLDQAERHVRGRTETQGVRSQVNAAAKERKEFWLPQRNGARSWRKMSSG